MRIALIFILLFSMNAFAKTNSYECHPVEFTHGVNKDFKLTLKKSFWKGNQVNWARIEDGFNREYPYPLEKYPTTLSANEYVEGKSFVKTDLNSSIIIIKKVDELFIEAALLSGADEGIVYHKQIDGNLMEDTYRSWTTFSCIRR